MDRHLFFKLCEMLGQFGGLKSTKHININQQVASINDTVYKMGLGHFGRPCETVSRYFSKVILSILRLHNMLTKTP